MITFGGEKKRKNREIDERSEQILDALTVRVEFERLLTVRDVAFILNMSERHIRRMCESGEIPCLQVAGRYRFEPRDLRRWLDERKGLIWREWLGLE